MSEELSRTLSSLVLKQKDMEREIERLSALEIGQTVPLVPEAGMMQVVYSPTEPAAPITGLVWVETE